MTNSLVLTVVLVALLRGLAPGPGELAPPRDPDAAFWRCWNSAAQRKCDDAPDHFAEPACAAARRCFDRSGGP